MNVVEAIETKQNKNLQYCKTDPSKHTGLIGWLLGCSCWQFSSCQNVLGHWLNLKVKINGTLSSYAFIAIKTLFEIST